MIAINSKCYLYKKYEVPVCKNEKYVEKCMEIIFLFNTSESVRV